MISHDIHITPEILMILSEIDEFKGRWNASPSLTLNRLKTLKWLATVESVGASLRMDGENLPNSAVESLLSSLTYREFQEPCEQVAAGYAHALHVIYEQYKEISLTESRIKQLHAVMFHYSPQSIHKGRYKTSPTDSKLLIPLDITREMGTLVASTQNALGDRFTHPLLIIAQFTLHFLRIRPFEEGNEALSRILTALLMLKSGYSYGPYSSHEIILETTRENYAQAYYNTPSSLNENQNDDTEILIFLKSLGKQVDNLKAEIQKEHLSMKNTPALSAQIIDLIEKTGRATVAQILKHTEAKRPTIKSYLTQMVNNGSLTRQGVGRSTWYTLSS
ncbi:MAG: Fic family protein [Alphaproteobacteria bacterium]|nr:Fic family protein [Alphaproteobacteria bacterium]